MARNKRPSFGLPRGPGPGQRMVGLPARPGPRRKDEVEEGFVKGLNRFLPDGTKGNGVRESMLSRMDSERSANNSTPGGKSVLNTPGVGKAL